MKRAAETANTGRQNGEVAKKMKMSTPSDGTREERRKEKKVRKQQANAEANPPKFFYLANEISKRREPVGIDDVRDAVLHIVADGPAISWLKVENTRNISKAVVLLIPGLTSSLLGLKDEGADSSSAKRASPISIPASVPALPFITKFMHALPTRAPGDQTKMHSVLSAFFSIPVTGEEKKRRLQHRIEQERLSPGSASNYVLTLEQMVDNGYPIPTYLGNNDPLPSGWVETPSYTPPQNPNSKPPAPTILALDCEMCVTEASSKALTHVTIVSYPSGFVVLDTLVMPREPITDYLTRFSGVTAKKLEGCTTHLEDVQRELKKLLSPPSSALSSGEAESDWETPILLGHSLDSDLHALRYAHPRCIDTSVIFHHPRGAPYKPGLAWLSKKWCEKEIQTAGEGGHDPLEDATACVSLLKKKLQNGPGFGEFKVDQETIFERIARAQPISIPSADGKHIGKRKRMSALVDIGNPSNWHGKKAEKCIGCKDDDEVVEGVKKLLSEQDSIAEGGEEEEEGEEKEKGFYKLIFARLTTLANVQGWIQPKQTADGGAPSASEDSPPAALTPELPSSTLSTLSSQLTDLYNCLPSNAALLIFTGHSDPRQMAALNTRRIKFETAFRMSGSAGGVVKDANGEAVKWTSEDGRKLEEETEKAKRGMMFMCLKR